LRENSLDVKKTSTLEKINLVENEQMISFVLVLTCLRRLWDFEFIGFLAF